MARALLSITIFFAGVAACQAQATNCYPRIGGYSGEYEGQCPNAGVKWTVTENTIGAFGRNCNDEPWTYNRNEKMFYHRRANEKFAMQDCYQPSREQIVNNLMVNTSTDAVRHFHEGKIVRPETPARQPIETPR